MSNALALRENMDLSMFTDTVRHGAELVRFLGIQLLPSSPDSIDVFACECGALNPVNAPACLACGTMNDPSNVRPETALEYTRRVWRKLDNDEREAAVDAGARQVVDLRDVLDDSMLLFIYQTYTRADRTFDNNEEFRLWVKETLVRGNKSASEASQLYSTILNITWLDAHGWDLGVKDPEEIFENPQLYARWRRVAGKIRAHIRDLDNIDDQVDIANIVDAVLDEEEYPHLDDLDRVGRQRPKTPIVTMIQGVAKHPLSGWGFYYCELSPTQKGIMQGLLGNAAQWALQGQGYGLEHHDLYQYRCVKRYVCSVCDAYRSYPEGAWCDDHGEEMYLHESWSYRRYDEKIAGFAEWFACEEPDLDNPPEGVDNIDSQLGVEYYLRWVRRE